MISVRRAMAIIGIVTFLQLVWMARVEYSIRQDARELTRVVFDNCTALNEQTTTLRSVILEAYAKPRSDLSTEERMLIAERLLQLVPDVRDCERG